MCRWQVNSTEIWRETLLTNVFFADQKLSAQKFESSEIFPILVLAYLKFKVCVQTTYHTNVRKNALRRVSLLWDKF